MKFLCFFAVILVSCSVNCGPNLPTPDGAQTTQFVVNKKTEFLSLMKKHIDLSLNYLFTSVALSSQKLERPGMGKYLRSLSDEHWEQGLQTLQKFFKRGGRIQLDTLLNSFDFTGNVFLNQTIIGNENYYLPTVQQMLTDSKEIVIEVNKLHREVQSTDENKHDAELGHFFTEKLEKETKRTRELAGYVTVLKNMAQYGLGLHMFDSNM